MTDCSNVDMREQLPDFIHGTLSEHMRARVQEHVDGCADCAQELAILRSVITLVSVPQIDTARIAAAIPAYGGQGTPAASGGPDDTVISLPVRRPWYRRASVQMAAGLMLAAIGLSSVVMHYDQSAATTSAVVQGIAATGSANDPGLTLVSVSSLSNGQIEQLIAGMDSLDALPSADPEPANSALLDGGGI